MLETVHLRTSRRALIISLPFFFFFFFFHFTSVWPPQKTCWRLYNHRRFHWTEKKQRQIVEERRIPPTATIKTWRVLGNISSAIEWWELIVGFAISKFGGGNIDAVPRTIFLATAANLNFPVDIGGTGRRQASPPMWWASYLFLAGLWLPIDSLIRQQRTDTQTRKTNKQKSN